MATTTNRNDWTVICLSCGGTEVANGTGAWPDLAAIKETVRYSTHVQLREALGHDAGAHELAIRGRIVE